MSKEIIKEHNDRKQYIDFLRAFATIGVIFIHVSANNWYGNIGTNDWIAFSIYEGLFKIAVPIFFMISGCLFLNSQKERSIAELFKNYIGRLIIFLIFWAIIYKLIQFPQNEMTFWENLRNALIEILNGQTQSHLWFVYAIIGMYLLVPLLRPVMKNTSKTTVLYLLIICIVFGSLYEFFAQYGMMMWLTNNLNKIKSGFSVGYVGYFLLGAYLDRYNIEKKYRPCIYILGILGSAFSIGMVIFDCISTQTLNERFWSYTMPGMYLASIAVFTLVRNMKVKNTEVIRVVHFISNNSLGIYGVHFAIIIFLWRVGFDTFSFAGVLSVPVISLIVLLLSLMVAYLLKKIPVVGKFIS